MNDADFFAAFEKAFGSKLGKALLKMYRDTLGEKDEEAEVVFADPFDVPNTKRQNMRLERKTSARHRPARQRKH